MAFHDLIAQTTGGEQVVFDCTHRRFEPIIADLLPRGQAWDRDDPVLQQLVAAEATELSRVDIRGRKLLQRELNPNETFELLTDWEEAYGLPECIAPDSIEARRAALAAKILAQAGHDQSPAYWIDLLNKLGYALHFMLQGPQQMTCEDDCMDVLADESWAFVWSMAVEHGIEDALLECLVEHNALIISHPHVHYLWSPVVLPEPIDFADCASSDKGYTVIVGGPQIVFAAGSLTSWDLAATQAEDIYAVCAVGSIFVAVGVTGGLSAIRSTDNGATWSTSTPFAGPELYAINRGPLDDQVAVAVGEDGRIFRTDDAGQNFAEEVSPASAYLYGVCCCTGAMVAVGNGGTVLRSTANGTAWASVAAGISDDLYAVAGRLNIVVAVGFSGVIWRSTDSGASWAHITSPTHTTLRAVAGSLTGRWVAVGDSGVIIHSLDAGLTWTLQVSPTEQNLRGACAHHPDGQLVVVGVSASIIVE